MERGTVRKRSGKSRTESQHLRAVKVAAVQTKEMAGHGGDGSLKGKENLKANQ